MKLYLSTAEFEKKGGWVEDTQFIEVLGVPYLLAHGLGEPVQDAEAVIEVPYACRARLYVYTYNWNAPWKPEYAPGLFAVKIGEYQHVFGNEGDAWSWQDGGICELKEGSNTVVLKDLTGLEGRCAAILLTDEIGEADALKHPAEYIPVSEEEPEQFELIVVGGGITGITTAVSAARNGVKTALVQDRPVLGGNNSSEVRVWLSGKLCFPRFPKLGLITKELEQKVSDIFGVGNRAENYEDEKKLALVENEKNITLYLNHALTEVTVTGQEGPSGVKPDGTLGTACVGAEQQITSITVLDIREGKKRRLSASLYADCTGDAVLGAKAGADFELNTTDHMEASNFWSIEDVGHPVEFPRCPWAIDLTYADFLGRLRAGGKDPEGEVASAKRLGCWHWGAGFEHDPIARAEYIRDTNFRAMYGAWDAVKNVDGDFKNYKLSFSSYVAGKRESRRLLGKIILTKSDFKKLREYPDALIGVDWHLDLHVPFRQFYGAYVEGDAFIGNATHDRYEPPYYMPYRCLYSRNISNLFMGGRCVSTTHDAIGPVRIMRTCGMMGEVIGTAAAIGIREGVTPDGVYQYHFEELADTFREV